MSEEKNWYIVHTQTGHEGKVQEKIKLNSEIQGLGDCIFDVWVPAEAVVGPRVVHVGGTKTHTPTATDPRDEKKKVIRQRKCFPGYVLVEMRMTSEAYWFIKNTAGVTGFLGDPNPVPVPEEEIADIKELVENTSDKPRHAINFERGESVRITEGPFKHFIGKVEEVNEQKNKLKVMVTVFDRATPVEVDFLQVEKN